MLRSPPATRHSQAAAWSVFAFTGVAAFVWQSPSVEKTSGSTLLTTIWVVFLLGGGTCSALGRILGRWVGEYVGLPLLAGAFAVYAVALLYSTIVTTRLTGITAASALVAIFLLVIARWFEVNEIRIESVRSGEHDRQQQDSEQQDSEQQDSEQQDSEQQPEQQEPHNTGG